MQFVPMPKVPRLSREVIITEKIDGTNASVFIETQTEVDLAEGAPGMRFACVEAGFDFLYLSAGSRTRWISPGDDNYGFAAWVKNNATELAKLGPGHHFGEWWGGGIQCGYGLPKDDKRWSLFNVARWNPHDGLLPKCCDVVPVLARHTVLDTALIELELLNLSRGGSVAAPGYMDPEGVMVYHTAANIVFKKTIKGDAEGKSREAHTKKEREPRPPKNPSIGGRRKGLTPGYTGPERRAQ